MDDLFTYLVNLFVSVGISLKCAICIATWMIYRRGCSA